MSKCSVKCNEIKQKIDSISGLDDDFIYGHLIILEKVVNSVVDYIDTYANKNKLNGTCFKEENNE